MSGTMYAVPPVYCTNWRSIIKSAEAMDLDSDSKTAIKLCKLAEDWKTCAVGEALRDVRSVIGLADYSGKFNWKLSAFGADFLADIDLCRWDLALKTVEKIEAECTRIVESVRGAD